MLSIGEWFISYVLPLFIDVSLLPSETMTDIRIMFALVTTFCAIGLLIWLPYKGLLYLLRGGRKKRF